LAQTDGRIPHNQPALQVRQPYYIKGEAETDFLKITRPDVIKFVDPDPIDAVGGFSVYGVAYLTPNDL
jgi:hypothetical protein